MRTGIPAIDKLIQDVSRGGYYQLIGDSNIDLSLVSLHFLKRANMPVYFDMRGDLNKATALAIVGKDLLLCQEDDGDKA